MKIHDVVHRWKRWWWSIWSYLRRCLAVLGFSQSIMSPPEPDPCGWGFRTEKGFLAESTFLVSCRLSLSISWAAEAGNPLKQMLGSKCSFLFCFIWYFCFVGLFRLIKTSAQLESLPMFDPFVGDFLGSPQIDMFWMWPPPSPTSALAQGLIDLSKGGERSKQISAKQSGWGDETKTGAF